MAILLSAWAPRAWAYGGDTHYYLRFASALDTCFDWDEAHLIASADYLVDKNRTTTAEKHPLKKHNKINWHAFSRNQERFNELWERVLQEQNRELQLVKLGQFLHYTSDWESHYGHGVRMGHGIPTMFARDPDSLGNDESNNVRMIDQTIYHMLRVCAAWGRTPEGDADLALVDVYWELADEPLMDVLFDTNTPRWKRWGKRWKMGKEILRRNHQLIEELIAKRGAGRPERNIPDDFTPGDPEKGLPPPLGLRYDKDGELQEILGVEIELLPEYDGTRLSSVEQDRLEQALETDLVDDLEALVQDGREVDLYTNVQLSLEDAKLTDDGWLVEVEIENLGPGKSEQGRLDLFVLDVATEELLGETSRQIPSMKGGETVAYRVAVQSVAEPTRRVLMGASLKVNDLSADNNDVWFVPWRNEVERTQKMKAKKKNKKRAASAVQFLGAAKMWVDDTGDAWMMLTAYVEGGDSSRRLGNVALKLGEAELTLESDRVWFSFPDLRRRLVPAKGGFLLPRSDAACRELENGQTLLEVNITGGDALPATTTFEMDPEFVKDALMSCRREGRFTRSEARPRFGR